RRLTTSISSTHTTLRPPPHPPLFPYTTLFRSRGHVLHQTAAAIDIQHRPAKPPQDRQDIERIDRIRAVKQARLVRAARHDRNGPDRKSTRLNSSHVSISYAVFCLKKKKI